MNSRSVKRAATYLLLLLFLSSLLPTANRGVSTVAHAASDPFTAVWFSNERDNTKSVAWGDVDNDGDLDLAVGNDNAPLRLYRNNGTMLDPLAAWSSNLAGNATSVAWGDVDNDGDLDLAASYGYMQPTRLFGNNGTTLTADPVWSSAPQASGDGLAWGDVDGDGDLDLAAGTQLYRNEGGVLTLNAVWAPTQDPGASSVAWGDVTGDGNLDLVVGTGSNALLYQNTGDLLTKDPVWSSVDGFASTVALGDVDNDGDLDLATVYGYAEEGSVARLYSNDHGVLTTSPVWLSTEDDYTTSAAWGDVDGDGDLDLITGSFGEVRLYRNEGRALTTTADWTAPEDSYVYSVAWGDVDGDGDLDLAVGTAQADDSIYQPNRLYRNEGNLLSPNQTWSAADASYVPAVAWGDVDNDGDLDLASGATLYINDNGVLTANPLWTGSASNLVSSVAWGDVDGDGYLDLAVGSAPRYDAQCQCYLDTRNRLYHNDGGTLSASAIWSSKEGDRTKSIAWGDVDGDGDLDLVVGNNGAPNRLYLNDGGTLTVSAVWSSTEHDDTNSVAWGDVDGDGDLDLATGTTAYPSSAPNRLYRNDNGVLTMSAVWSSNERDETNSVAWGDVDGDGDLDLAVGNEEQPARLYRNDGGTLTASAVWSSVEHFRTKNVAWGDADNDGDLDLVVGGTGYPANPPVFLYRNNGGQLTTSAAWSSADTAGAHGVAWGDVDGDGDLDLAADARLYRNVSSGATYTTTNDLPTVTVLGPNPAAGAAAYSTAPILNASVIPIYYKLADAEGDPVTAVQAEYSLDGGGYWLPAIAASDAITSNLTAAPSGTPHIFRWDTSASGLFGQSDDVVFRIRALPDSRIRPKQVPGPFQRPSAAAVSQPFRVRGTQPRVLRDGQPVSGAVVYRLPQGAAEGATLVAASDGRTFRTNHLGYLEGRGIIARNDRLVALQEVGRTEKYTLYNTSAAPTLDGLDALPVTSPGVQTLTISPDNALVLLNLSVSLEWDARSDADFMQRLRSDLRRVSGSLYAWSDGQIALGTITLYQNKDHWHDRFDARGNLLLKGADIRVRATNRLRPNASQGGIGLAERTDPDVATVVYEPGHVRVGAVWNRDGSPEQRERNSDWALALAHELGHYAFFLDDNYLGLNDAKQLVAVASCPGAMSDPYSATPVDFRPDGDWLPACKDTLSNRSTGRSDWATIRRFYNGVAPGFELRQPRAYGANPGPATLPLAVTQFDEPAPPPDTAATTQVVALTKAEGGTYTAGASARAFRFSGGGARITDLGEPANGQVLARGMQAGDTVCMYDLQEGRSGCGNGSALALQLRPAWQPDVLLTLVTSRTAQISVPAASIGAAPASGRLQARLFPSDSAQAPSDADLTLVGDQYQGTLTLPEPALEGYVRVWADEAAPRREAVTNYTIGGNPAPPRRPPRRSRRKAPMISSDGQVLLLADDIDFKPGEFFALQTVTHLPAPPAYAAPIGAGYRLLASKPAPSLVGVGINVAFATSDLPTGSDGWVALYYYPADGTGWRRLSALPGRAGASEVNAAVEGPGIYALMASVPFTIKARGWNQLPYPGATAALPDALRPITGSYQMIYGYDDSDADDPWKIYGPSLPAWANDLRELEQGASYWVYVNEPLTAPVGPVDGSARAAAPRVGESLTLPPAFFYGTLVPMGDFEPKAGMVVEARVNNTTCGSATTQPVDGKVVVAIDVRAASGGADATCGTKGAAVTFMIDGYEWPLEPQWNNTRLNELRIYRGLLPLVRAAPAPADAPSPPGDPDAIKR